MKSAKKQVNIGSGVWCWGRWELVHDGHNNQITL